MYFFFLIRSLPSVESLKDYKPPLISTVFDRNDQKIGEFFKQRRVLVPYEQFPEVLVKAFVAAEDGQFFKHKGLNIRAIFRAFLANLKAGRKVQGGSTITQQVARSLLLSSEKTYKRKFKEAVLALRIEKNLSKEEILYLYLNQIYLGHGAYGVGMAAEIYFRKKVKDLNLAECSLLAGLPQAPSRFSPIYNPGKAKERQVYVLQRMVEERYIDQAEADQVNNTNLKVFLREKYHEKAPYYLETLRQSLLEKIDEELLLTGGVKVKSAMDLTFQKAARKHLKEGLRALDKRQGFRGPLNRLTDLEAIQEFFKKEEEKWIEKKREYRIIYPIEKKDDEKNNEDYLKTIEENSFMKALVKEVNDESKKVLIQLPFNFWGILPLENMKWARKPDPKTSFKFFSLKKPSLALKSGDVILVKVEELIKSEEAKKEFLEAGFKTDFFKIAKENSIPQNKNLYILSLEQEPLVEGALIAFDQKTGDILALVGGYDFHRSQFNRAYQAARQTGSVFKPLVYLSALDKGFTPSSLITDTPVIYEEEEAEDLELKKEKQKRKASDQSDKKDNDKEETEEQKTWKPDNYGRRFSGDILFRNALIQSMNVPTVKIIENIGVRWVNDYARRLGIFSPLNPDYTLALGSSSVTLYEMTKVFSVIGKLGKKITPLLIHEVLDSEEEEIVNSVSMDERFFEQIQVIEEEIETKKEKFLAEQKKEDEENTNKNLKRFPPFFFSNSDQLISEKTSFVMTSLLSAVIREPQGTGFAAREIKVPVAGKTGTTNGYYDAWFIGYSPQVAVGVWVGFDDEKSLGRGETGAQAALPIWLGFMKEVHDEKEKEEFKVPEGVIFINVDNETGHLVSTRSKQIVRQAFIEGTQPLEVEEFSEEEDQNFLREDFSR